jgi:hypothetical protein
VEGDRLTDVADAQSAGDVDSGGRFGDGGAAEFQGGNRAAANTLSARRRSSRNLMPVSTLSVQMIAEIADSVTEEPIVIADSYRSNRPFTFMPKAALA